MADDGSQPRSRPERCERRRCLGHMIFAGHARDCKAQRGWLHDVNHQRDHEDLNIRPQCARPSCSIAQPRAGALVSDGRSLVIALIIDVMKPAALGFTMPGHDRANIMCPRRRRRSFRSSRWSGLLSAPIVWGAIADIYGRKASILLSAVLFVGTSICGTMPLARLEYRHVLHDGRRCRRHASRDLCPARRNDAEPASRLEPRAGRRARCGRRLFRSKRFVGACCSRCTAGGSCGCSTFRPACFSCCSASSFPNPRSSCSPAGRRDEAVRSDGAVRRRGAVKYRCPKPGNAALARLQVCTLRGKLAALSLAGIC